MSKINTTIKTLNDLGDMFPIGVVNIVNGEKQLNKAFSLRELSTPLEREFGRFKSTNPKILETTSVTKLMSLMISNYNGEDVDFSGQNPTRVIQEGEALFKIGDLYMADVFYAYCKARIAEMGSEYPFLLNCPACNHEEVIQADLTTMDVHCIEDAKDLELEVELFHGFDSPNGGKIKKVIVVPQKWADMCSDEFGKTGEDETLLKLYFIEKCTKYILSVDKKKSEVVLSKDQLNQLKKIDREKIAQAISSLNIGPVFNVDCSCPKCNYEFGIGVDWRYSSFFSISSH